MWIANNWKDYEVLDCSNGEKLERWGDYILVRPERLEENERTLSQKFTRRW